MAARLPPRHSPAGLDRGGNGCNSLLHNDFLQRLNSGTRTAIRRFIDDEYRREIHSGYR